jgi:uncharacterized protein YidB (DUF937 family)
MGLLDSLISGALGQMLGGGQARNGLIEMVLGMIQNQPGGLQGLINQFAKAGLGQQAQSWVSTGANMPISAEDLMKVLGQGQLQSMGSQFGLNPQQTAGGLSAILPEIINQLTPQGQVTQGNEFDSLLGALRGRL